MKGLFSRIRAWRLRTKFIVVIFLLAVAWGAYAYIGSQSTTYQTVPVERGTLSERVDLTGSVTPTGIVSLSFQNAGTIARVDAHVGDTVTQGQSLVSLDTNSLQTQLAQAQANVNGAQAKLASLKAGPTPSAIAVSRSTLVTAQQNLTADYTSAISTIISSYASAIDAVRTKLNVFFTNPDTSGAQIVFATSDAQAAMNAQYERSKLNPMFSAWQNEISGLSASSSPDAIHTALANASDHLTQISRFLANLSEATIRATSFPSSTGLTLATAQTTVTASVSEINTAFANVSNAQQTIASQETVVAQNQAKLNQTLAGSTPDDIAAQQAAVEAAQAQVHSIQVQISQATLRSPIDGTVSVQNAKVGQTETPSQTMTTVFSSKSLEVDVNLPEVDLGKAAVGDPVDITFDAFPGETFKGKIFFIDPAETVVDGVVGYKTKISFDKLDPRIKSGLTANLSIITETKQNALYVPQYAITQTDTGSYVEVLRNGKPVQVPVTTGIQDESGKVEITSGVTEGEQVVNVGLKSGG